MSEHATTNTAKTTARKAAASAAPDTTDTETPAMVAPAKKAAKKVAAAKKAAPAKKVAAKKASPAAEPQTGITVKLLHLGTGEDDVNLPAGSTDEDLLTLRGQSRSTVTVYINSRPSTSPTALAEGDVVTFANNIKGGL